MGTSWVGSCRFCRRKQMTQNPSPCIFKRRQREATSLSCIKHSTVPSSLFGTIFCINLQKQWVHLGNAAAYQPWDTVWTDLSPPTASAAVGPSTSFRLGHLELLSCYQLVLPSPLTSPEGLGAVWGDGMKQKRRKHQYWVVKCCLNGWIMAPKWNTTRNLTWSENMILNCENTVLNCLLFLLGHHLLACN